MRKIGFENFVHGVIVLNLCQENSELQDAVHGTAAYFDESLDVLQNSRRVRLDVGWKFFLRVARVRSLSGDIDNSVVYDERRDKSGAIGRLSVVAQLANTALVLVVAAAVPVVVARAELPKRLAAPAPVNRQAIRDAKLLRVVESIVDSPYLIAKYLYSKRAEQPYSRPTCFTASTIDFAFSMMAYMECSLKSNC